MIRKRPTASFMQWVVYFQPTYPFCLLPLVAATFPKGTAFRGSGEPPGTAQGVPLGKLSPQAAEGVNIRVLYRSTESSSMP